MDASGHEISAVAVYLITLALIQRRGVQNQGK